MLVTPTYADPPYDLLISLIEGHSGKSNLPAEIYELGAEAYESEIAKYPWSMKTPKTYHKMADMYWRANNKSKALEAEQKAIEELKSKKDFSRTDMAAFESRLQKYKNM